MKALKTAAKGLVLGVSIFALAGVAHADVDFNMYGASAQYNFFSNAAAGFLTGQLGCTASPAPVTYTATGDSNSKVTVGLNCTVVAGQTVNFRYSSKASFDGVEVVQGSDSDSPTICANKFQRPMATCASTGCNAATMLTTTDPNSCQTVTVGTSDVQASSFLQSSQGNLKGPAEAAGSDEISRNFTGISAPTPPLTRDDPLAYPFAFYVNPGVKSTRCTDTAHFDTLCLTDTDCGGVVGSCLSNTIDNLSRLQAELLFTGQIAYWSDFGTSATPTPGTATLGTAGGYYTTKPVTLCFRHAGSGTMATLQLGVIKGKGWGGALPTVENDVRTPGNVGNYPYIYFNDATSNELNCLAWVNGNTTIASDNMSNYDTGAEGGAVGYADADNVNTGDYIQVKYNGYAANRINMRDGLYDDFWAINRMYRNKANLNGDQTTVYNKLLPYLNNPANINSTTVGASKALTYGSVSELRVSKTGNDASYPTEVPSPVNPQTP